LATVLFTDIVGSTEKAAELGDRRWRYLLDNHHDRLQLGASRSNDGDEKIVHRITQPIERRPARNAADDLPVTSPRLC
jgi:hypothetical protein